MASQNGVSVEKLRAFALTINMEPAIFLLALAYGIAGTAGQNFIYFKICIDTMQDSSSTGLAIGDLTDFCSNINGNISQSIRDMIQVQNSYFIIYNSCCGAIPSLISTMALGAWSDKTGRKPPVIIATTGQVLCFFLYILVASFPLQASINLILLGQLIYGFMGGFSIMIACSFSSVMDLFQDPSTQTLRVGLLEALMMTGMVVGSLISGLLMQLMPYASIFLISEAAFVTGIFYLIIVVRETLRVNQPEKGEQQMDTPRHCFIIRSILVQYKEAFQTMTKRRDNNARSYIIIGTICFLTLFISSDGMSSVFLLFVKHSPFYWSASHYAYYSSGATAVAAVGLAFFMVLFKKLLKLSDSVVVLIGMAMLCIRLAVLAASRYTWMIYMCLAFTSTGAIAFPTLRTFLAKLADKDESGKIFALIANFETIGPLLATVTYSNIYAASIKANIFNGLTFAVASAVVFLTILVFGWITWKTRTIVKPTPESTENCDSTEST